MGGTARMGMAGSPPVVKVGKANPEAEKYGRIWAHPEYRKVAPGEGLASVFLAHARPRPGAEVIDFGCGTGRGALMLCLLGRVKVTMVDFVRNSLDPDIQAALKTQPHALTFVKADLEVRLPVAAEYGYCTDVMEHIPPKKVERVLINILKAAQHVFFSISTVDDSCGALIGERLHLTVQPATWWRKKLTDIGATIHWDEEVSDGYLAYVTAWSDGQKVVDGGVLNIQEQQIRANVAQNITGAWQPMRPHMINTVECMILGGGPSMVQHEAEIRAQRAAGVKLITLNGAYIWALEHGLVPSAQVVVDARPFNTRFTRPVVDGCKYFIASQCDPGVFEGLPPDRTWVLHTAPGLVKDLLDAHYGDGGWYAIPGGSTVLLRAIPVFRMLGFTRFHLYGCDSCLMMTPSVGAQGDPPPQLLHHGYAQPENDSENVIAVTTNPGGRIFHCHPWMIAQAQELLETIRVFGHEIELAIHGDGLLAYMLRTVAELDLQTIGE